MGKRFKRRLQSIFCCCIKVNKVAPFPLDDLRTPSRFSESPVDPVSKNLANDVPVAPAASLPRQSPAPPSYISDDLHSSRPVLITADTVAAIRAVAGINLARICFMSNSRARVINIYSDHPSDTPLPYPIYSTETNAVVGIVIRGSFSQDSLGPMLVNAQCTSMAYQSLAYKTVLGQPNTWNYRDIDSILRQGHLLHSHFRYIMRISSNPDERIALHELPMSFNERVLPPDHAHYTRAVERKVNISFLYAVDGIFAYNCRDMANSLSNVAPEFPMFMLQTFTSEWSEDLNMILTINDYTMAIWRRGNEATMWMFDRHRRDTNGLVQFTSSLELQSLDPGAALARSFVGVEELICHITGIYGYNFYYNARFFNLDMADTESIPAIGNGTVRNNDSTVNSNLSANSLYDEKHPP